MVSRSACPICKRKFLSPDNLYRGVVRPKIFCSNKCYQKHYKQKNKKLLKIKNCLHCNKQFSTERDKQLFCSKDCYVQSDYRKEKNKKLKQTDEYKEWAKDYYKKNKKVILNKQKKLIQTKESLEKRRKYWESPSYKNKRKEKRQTNKYKNQFNEYIKNRRSSDPIFKMMGNMRNRIIKFLKIKKLIKTSSTHQLIGCTPKELVAHLEKQFKPGMTWDNHSFDGWHVDHIIPLDSAKNEEDVKRLCHYTNLQPMWASDNLKKSNKF